MADEEVKDDHAKTAERMIEVWASTVDALLQQWLEQGRVNDRLGVAITSFRLSQLGLMLMNYFKMVGQEFISGPTEVRAAEQAVEHMDTTVRRAMAAAGIGKSFRQDQKTTDPSMN